jgi:uncharacterized protein (TIGR03790 family)
MARKLTAVLFTLLILAAASCAGNGNAPATQTAAGHPVHEQLAQGLPGVNSLPYPAAVRRASATGYELLGEAPVKQSSAGVSSAPGLLMLDPAATAEGFAWAIFALNGFPTDHSIYPTGFNVTTDAGCWIAYSDYAKGHWDFYQATESGGQTYADGAQLISPAGAHYVAVIAVSPVACTVTSLQVSTSAELPEAPVAVLNAPPKMAQSIPADFSALGSTPGSGVFTSIVYHWGDGAADDTVTDPSQVVQHTFATTGPQTITLTVTTDQTLSDTDEKQVTAIPAMRELLLVYNDAIPEDLDLANYYASPVTGRAVDPEYILGIHPTAEADPEVITWANYLSTIRDPIKAYLDANTNIKNGIKYILLCKGVPYKIYGENQFNAGQINTEDASSPLISLSSFSSVDSDLCLLYNDYDRVGWMYSGAKADYMGFSGSGFYLKGSSAFTPNTFKVSWVDYNDTTAPYTFLEYTLNYLVGRLNAYSYDNVKQLIDRAVNADTTGTGSIIFDSSNAEFGGYVPPKTQNQFDTMVDPVWPWPDNLQSSGYELLHGAGYSVFADATSLRLTGAASDNILVPIDKVIGYAGWGVNHAGGSYANGVNYILKDLLFTYRPGACWMSYESFNGQTFTCSDPSDPSTGHPGQGQIADFLYKGGTVAIGNANEPFTIGCGDERWVFDRYIDHGDRWIEAAYKGLRLLSWQEVVVGDPLCKVK